MLTNSVVRRFADLTLCQSVQSNSRTLHEIPKDFPATYTMPNVVFEVKFQTMGLFKIQSTRNCASVTLLRKSNKKGTFLVKMKMEWRWLELMHKFYYRPDLWKNVKKGFLLQIYNVNVNTKGLQKRFYNI